ncbi:MULTISPECIES: tRNA glutamyl-Q(34) synthetase GluQRS [unclassified Oleiphilus]|jgi:glutamyl-Q tRNA(Asp) synthetase|nr:MULTISPECIES: tRNA glutamyl-Q(34) synthetase GluQRS [unclassified Oleiphilus]KZY77294.1 hypothetical protein A3740_10600 [Oleiphilus sp. HI0068]KZY83291.1 hypothetical protein A3741_03675 [Oleiphilus sp. HI0069]KZY89442.1 hypothetical protein A3743_08330 [Oleiphilus sp. HI0072]KZZ32745.1 hypothetical protein A3755_01230 [Oleiphilus sp. HI0085]KZY39538.1 hypothetical protein A3729_14840 [Oleiphilus sp. HI0043]
MSSYRGRFAPSPTGPLHFGSLFAALVSYLEARRNSGTWLVRIEDIDPLREAPGASQQIIETLEAHHLFSDEPIVFQSAHSAEYESLLTKLDLRKAIFYCPCSRKYLATNGGRHNEACLRQSVDKQNCAQKFRNTEELYYWHDGMQGEHSYKLDDDFVLKRKESFYAYQLAVVNDDHRQNITHVVRGYDLLFSTPMQLALYQALDYKPPEFSHFPVLSAKGQKLSKQNHAKAVSSLQAKENLSCIFRLLGIEISSKCLSIPQMLETAIEHWNPKVLSRVKELPSPY